MKNMVDLYEAQHQRALDCAKDIITASDNVEAAKKNAENIRLRLAALSGILKVHFSSEDRLIYQNLMVNTDSHVAGTAQRFWDDLGGITDAVMVFLNRWREIGNIEKEPEIFLKESRDIFTALQKRIDAEEAELYPMFVKHFT